jgi:lincosamide nucleotidyltransferase A/C/D/E
MRGDQLVDLLDRLAPVTSALWLGGGWAVDALVGHQTRPHGDADLAVDAPSLPAVLEVLTGDGFAPAEDWLPVRIELAHPDGRRVDLHPLDFRPDGSATQANLPGGEPFRYPAGCTTTGTVAGRPVTCLTVAQQLAFRQGFTPRPQDHHDTALLHGLS